jgi:hypothetical protein
MRYLAALALGVILISTVFATRTAASCVEPNLADQVARADVIAYGTVMRPVGLPFFPPARTIKFRVDRVLKGTAQFEMDVTIGPGGAAVTSVDYQADDGTAHTLYLRRTGDAFATDACSGSHPGQPSAEETALLGQGGLRIVTDHPTNWAPPLSIGVIMFAAAAIVAFLGLRRRRPNLGR